MVYRDETEGLRARVSELEQELAEAHARIAVLEGRQTAPAGPGKWLLGAPTRLAYDVELEGELSDSAYEEIVAALRERFGLLGQVTTVGRTLAWTTAGTPAPRFVELTVSAHRRHTRIRGAERLGNLAGGLYGGIFGGAGGGGMGLLMPLLVALGISRFMPWFALVWLLVVYLFVRLVYARTAARRAAELASAVDAVASIARAHLSASRARLRVDEDDEELEENAIDERKSSKR